MIARCKRKRAINPPRTSRATLIGRHRVCLSATVFLAGCVWVGLFPLISVTTGEAKPRSTFIAENAILQHAPPGFGPPDADFALALQRGFAERTATASLQQAAGWLAAACRNASLDAEVQAPVPNTDAFGADRDGAFRTPHGDRLLNVVCSTPARGTGRGYEYLMLSAALETSGVSAPAAGGLPHEALVALALARSLALRAQQWLAKDVVVLLTLTEPAVDAASQSTQQQAGACAPLPVRAGGAASSPQAHAGVDLFLQSHDWAAQAGHAVQAPACIAPLAHHHGQLRGALHLRTAPGAVAAAASHGTPPTHAALSLSAPDGRLPELDFATLLSSSMGHAFRAVGAGEAADAGGACVAGRGDEDLACAADAWVAAAASRGMAALARAPPGSQLLGPVLDAALRHVVSPVASALAGRPVTVGRGDAGEWLRRLAAAARFAWRGLWGPFAPSAPLVRAGLQAATVTLGRQQDLLLPAPQQQQQQQMPTPAAAAQSALPECRLLSPCEYRSLVAASAGGLAAAPASSAAPAHTPQQSALTPGAAAQHATFLGASLERVLRAMSGTEERLHASHPGYLLLAPTLFVGLGEYLSAAGLAHVPLLLATLTGLPARDAVVVDALCYALLLALAGAKGALLLGSGSSALVAAAGAALARVLGLPAAASSLSAADLALPLAVVDAVAALALIPLLRNCLRRVRWCDRRVLAAEDARLIAAAEGRPLHATAQETPAAANGTGAAAAAAAAAPVTPAAASPQPQQPAPTAPPPPAYPLLPAVFIAWLGLGFQQLQLLYASHPLFLLSAAALVPPLIAASAPWLAADAAQSRSQLPRGGASTSGDAAAATAKPAPLPQTPAALPLAQRLGLRPLLLLLTAGSVYAVASPLGWSLIAGEPLAGAASAAGGGAQLLVRAAELSRGFGSLHVPVLLHAQALAALLASAAVVP